MFSIFYFKIFTNHSLLEFYSSFFFYRAIGVSIYDNEKISQIGYYQEEGLSEIWTRIRFVSGELC